ncbi:MAG: hypothetical protein WBW16_14660 [Bacteroidota bacterium]
MLRGITLVFSFICMSFLHSIDMSAQDMNGVRENSPGISSGSLSNAAEGISRTRGHVGIGVVLGEPTGITGKYWLSSRTAIDGAFGYSFGDRFRISVDYLVQATAADSPDFLFYYGLGGAMAGDRGYIAKSRRSDFALGARGVIGVSYLFKRAPLDAFLEIAPIIFIAPPLGLSMDFCFGTRVYP